MNRALRIAYFPDSFNEVNGIAMTSNKLVEYAKKRDLPFLCVHAGDETKTWQDGSITYLSLKRSLLSFPVDEALRYDPTFHRHYFRAKAELEKFGADVIHITGVNDVGWLGMHLSRTFRLPLVGSWHTNLHEYAALRLKKVFRLLPSSLVDKITAFAERKILKGEQLFYKIPHVVLAPNRELTEMLARETGRRSMLMGRGVDTEFFSPEKRSIDDGIFRIGFVGRLRAEKDVGVLPQIAEHLERAGKTKFEFLIVGEGSERRYLEENISRAEFPGFLSGEPLARAYANMDVFVFPSETDTFGNVIQEAAASGVPSIVTDKGGPKFLVHHSQNGFVASGVNEFARYVIELMDDREKLDSMKTAAREFAMTRSWDAVFDGVYNAYDEAYDFVEERKRSSKGEQLKLAHGKSFWGLSAIICVMIAGAIVAAYFGRPLSQGVTKPVVGTQALENANAANAGVAVPPVGNSPVTNDQKGLPFDSRTDKMASADFDGDGKTDTAVFRSDDPSKGKATWYVLKSSDGSLTVCQFGLSTDVPAPKDYDGDGRADIAVWRTSDRSYYSIDSSDNRLRTYSVDKADRRQ